LLTPIIYTSMDEEVMTDSEKFEKSMLAMMTLGIGEIIGGIVMGYLVDRIGTKKACFINVFNITFTIMITAIYINQNSYSGLAFFMTFLWGLQDGCISIHLDAILGFEFESNKEPFSIDCLLESITVFTI
jgi:MFS family permease